MKIETEQSICIRICIIHCHILYYPCSQPFEFFKYVRSVFS